MGERTSGARESYYDVLLIGACLIFALLAGWGISIGHSVAVMTTIGAFALFLLGLVNPFAMTVLFVTSIAFDKIQLVELGGLVFTLSKTLGILLGACWLVTIALKKRQRFRVYQPMILALAGLAVLSILSTLVNEPRALLSQLSTTSLVILPLVLSSFVSSEERLYKLLLTIALVMTLEAVLAIAQAALGYDPLHLVDLFQQWTPVGRFPRAGGTFQDPNYFSLYTSMALPVWIDLARTSKRQFQRRMAIGGALLVSIGILTSLSLGGMTGLIVIAAYSIFSSRREGRLRLILWILLVGLVPMMSYLGDVYVERWQGILERIKTGGSRFQIWTVTLNMIAHNAIFGVGTSNFLLLFPRYDVFGIRPQWAHNTYLSIAAKQGLPAAIVFIVILMLIARMLWIPKRREKRPHLRNSSLLKSFSFVLKSMYLGYLAQSLFLNAENDKIIWILAGLALALYGLPAPQSACQEGGCGA